MRQEQTLSPSVWLSKGPMAIGNPAAVLQAFQPGTVRVVRFVGPHRLLRAAGWDMRSSRPAANQGSWWADEQWLSLAGTRMPQFETLLPAELQRHAWTAPQRGLASLCEDWAEMRDIFRLDLPAREELTGVVGLAAQAPRRASASSTMPALPQGEGGELAFFKRSASLSAINSLWVHAERLW